MTPEEAEKAFAEAPCVPLTEKQIHRCVEWVLGQENKALRQQRDALLAAAKTLREIMTLWALAPASSLEKARMVLDAAIAKTEGKERDGTL